MRHHNTRYLLGAFLAVGLVTGLGAQSIDVTIDEPTVRLKDALSGSQSSLDTVLQGTAISELENQIEGNQDLARFADLQQLALGAAHAGTAAAHLGTQRAFTDYRAFALVVGTGVGFSAPSTDPETLTTLDQTLEQEGDVYLGAAIQPVSVSLGVNLSRWIPRTRADVKVGYASIAPGTVAENIAFNAISAGLGVNHQIMRSRQLPLGFIRWRGLTLAGGFLYQNNRTDIEVDVTDQAFEQEVTFGDLGLTDVEVQAAFSDATASASDPLATLRVSPTVSAAVESTTYSIPLEVTTGLRLLWLLDVNVGAGVDLAFGSSEVVFGGDAVVAVDSGVDEQYLESSPGSISFGVSNTASPQFVRPRLTGGVGLNLGPVKLDVPVMLYFEPEGSTAMAGVNLGIVW